nr:restriction endonuclease subunit S [Aerococcus sanguinicola]
MGIFKFDEIAFNSTEKKKPVDEDKYTYLGLEHLDSDSIYVTRYGADVAPKGDKLIMKKGDVLFGKRRAYQKKVAIAPFDGIFSAHGMVLRPKEDVIDKEFFPMFIKSDYFLDAAIKISVGSLSPTINWRDLKELKFELPSLEKQRKLAEVLWAIYDMKDKYKKLILATDELVKSQFIEMFDRPEYERVQLKDISTLFADGDWIETKDQSDDGIRLVQTGNVGNGYYIDKDAHSRYVSEETFLRLNCTEILPGDILISRLPDPVGRGCILPDGIGKAITAVDCTIVRLKDMVEPEYLIGFTLTGLYQSQIESVKTGTTRKRISRKNLEKVLIPVPPIEKQMVFVELVKESDKSKFYG